MNKFVKAVIASSMLLTVSFSMIGCSNSRRDSVVIYTNADEEAVEAMEDVLDENGYKDKYILRCLGTSELGGKLLIEGSKMEADLVTMSSYYLESAQEKNNMFVDLNFETNSLLETPSYYVPVLANTGSLFINTKLIEEKNLKIPTSIKDLISPEYKDLVSIPNIMDSSTAWLLIQAIISEYGTEEGETILKGLIANAGPHIESSGSGPIKKVRAGEVAVGFGLRHQAVRDKNDSKPVDYVDPIEGNFTLTESIAVVKKEDEKTKLAMEMAEVIVKNAREELIKNYPVALYEGEVISEEDKPKYPKEFEEPLTVDLLGKHQEFFKKAKGE